MIATVRVEPEAEADVLEAAEWYEARRGGLGAAFIVAFAGVLDSLGGSPARHRALDGFEDFRRARLPRFPYHVIFRIDVAVHEVVVVAVAHGRREPGHWTR